MNGIDNVQRRLLAPILLTLLALVGASAQTTQSPRHIGFVENRGQWAGSGRFLARYAGLDLWVTDDALVYDFHRVEPQGLRGHVVRMSVGDGSGATDAGLQLPERRSYLNGAERSRWHLDVPAFADVAIRRVMPGVDLVVYDDGGSPRYDLHVAPGVDARHVRLRFDGADRVSVNANGALEIATSIGVVEQRGLEAYQMIGGVRCAVACEFDVASDGSVGFKLGEYDRRYALVVDPLTYSTFIGGPASDAANAVAVDSEGNAYVVGETSSATFPYVTGSYFATLRGTTDGFVSKLTADGSSLVYSTFIGGTDVDAALDVAVDAGGFAYVVGMTRSRDFPVRFGYDSSYNGAADAFVMKLDTNGSRFLFSTVIGGSSDDVATAVALGDNNAVYVAGNTLSSSFPTTPGAFQTTAARGAAFALKLEGNGTSLTYSTFIGGDNLDEAVDLAVNDGYAYVAGNTLSDGSSGTAFPTTTGAAQMNFGGMTDGFVAALDTNGRAAIYVTLLGGADVDEIGGIAVDATGSAVVTGQTSSATFPTTGGVYQSTLSGASDAFVTKLGPAGSSLLYSTLLGGGGIDQGVAVSFADNGLAIVSGNTRSSDYPATSGALQLVNAGSQDVFVTQLDSIAGTLVYSSLLGGTGNDSLRGATYTGSTTLYLAGTSSSIDYPTTIGAFATLNAGGFDAFVSRFDFVQLIGPNGRNTLCAGDSHLISWTGSTTVNYDIAISANDGLTWSPIALTISGNSFLWGIPAQFAPGTAYRIRVSVAGGTEFDVSDTAFTILAPPTILSHPTSFTRAAGTTATFSSNGTGSAPLGIYWERSNDLGATWARIPGATANEYTTGGLVAGDDSAMFRASYYNGCDTVSTRPAMITVLAVQVTAPAGGEVYCLGSTVTIEFMRQHVETVNIELSTNGGIGWTVLANNVTGGSYDWTIPMSMTGGTDFRIRVEDAQSSASDISDQSFSVHSAAFVIVEPGDVTTSAGSPASFTARGDGFPGYTLQWQTRAAGATQWTDVPDGTVSTLFINPVRPEHNGTQYRAIVTNACGSDTTRVATLTVSGGSGVESDDALDIALAVRPNPARDEAVASFTTKRATTARMVIVDARGAIVRTLVDGPVTAGVETVRIDTRSLAVGTYRIVLTLGGTTTSTGLVVQ